MSEKKLSEIMNRFLFKGNYPDGTHHGMAVPRYYLEITTTELEEWMKSVEALETERDNLLISNERIGLMYSVEDYKKLEVEVKTLKRQFEAFVDGSNQGLDFKQGVIDGQNILIVEHQKRYDELNDRLSKTQALADNWIASAGGLTTYIHAGEKLQKALGGESTTKGEDKK